MLPELDSLLAEATDAGAIATEENVVLNGSIDAIEDVDLYGFELEQGQGITLDVDAIATNADSSFDSFLRVFDAEGNEVAFNDDSTVEETGFTLDSYAGFIANNTGQYYVGISTTGNQNYSLIDGISHSSSGLFTPGEYNLTLELVDVVADDDADSTIAEATPLVVNADTQTGVAEEEINNRADVDFYSVELARGEGVYLNLSGVGEDSNFDSYLRFFDRDGNELAFNDDSGDRTNPTTDSAIAFLPNDAGEYFIGVSSGGNFDYDETNGNTNLNFSSNQGVSTGEYRLEVEVAEAVADDDDDNTIAEAIANSADNNAPLAGEIDSELDVDVYQFELARGEGVNLDLNTEGLDSELNSYLRLFDAEGNELATDDNNDANFTGEFHADAYLSFVADTPGTYYAAVGTSGNFNYDVVNGRSNFSVDVVSPLTTTGAYELEINILEVEPDSDTDNTIGEVSALGATATGNRQIRLESIDSPNDVDLYRLDLVEGEGVTIDLDTVLDSELDSYLRLFDGEGKELAVDNDDDLEIAIDANSNTDSFLSFAPTSGGAYYLGVSSDGNIQYDVLNGSNNFTPTTGFSSGAYELAISTAPIVADTDADNTLDEAIAITLDGSATVTVSDAIETTADLDIYQVELNTGETIGFDLDTAGDSRLDTFVKVFDSLGNELAANDDGAAADENSSLDSYIEFTALTADNYYFGVSSFGNFSYDPVAGSNNFSNSIGNTTGNYDLNINLVNSVNAIAGTEMADNLNGTPEADLISGLAGNDALAGAEGADNITGGSGNDSLLGEDGDDLLQGGVGNDTLAGGMGNDVLDGDKGIDRLVGNAGVDTFILDANDGSSNIRDFEAGIDKIALSFDISFEDITLSSVGSSTDIIFADRTIATVIDVEPSDISALDFVAVSGQL